MNEDFLMSKIAEVAPAAHLYMMAATEELRDSPFRDEVAGEVRGIFKTAAATFAPPMQLPSLVQASGPAAGGFFSRLGGGLGNAALGVAGTAVQGVALGLAGDAVDAIRRGITKSRDYKRMLAENPDLGKHPLGAKAVQGIFSTLHRFNPQFAKDPYVAGTFVRNHLESAGADKKQIDLGTLTNLISSRKNLADAESRQMPLMQKQWESPLDRQRKQMEIKRLDYQLQNLDPHQVQRLQQQIQMDAEMHPQKKEQLLQQTELLLQQTGEMGQRLREVDRRYSDVKEREALFQARERSAQNIRYEQEARAKAEAAEAAALAAQRKLPVTARNIGAGRGIFGGRGRP